MLQTDADSKKNLDEKDSEPSDQKLDKTTSLTNSDPSQISQRNNQMLNSIIEEVRRLLESDSE